MFLQTIFAQLWRPIKEQLSLFRALASGGRIPGTNLILMPAAVGEGRFGILEHCMMALAGGWLLLRVICCELADKETMENSNTEMPVSYKQKWDQTQQRENIQKGEAMPGATRENELFIWSSPEEESTLRFTRSQLDIMLRLEYEDDVTDYVDAEQEHETQQE